MQLSWDRLCLHRQRRQADTPRLGLTHRKHQAVDSARTDAAQEIFWMNNVVNEKNWGFGPTKTICKLSEYFPPKAQKHFKEAVFCLDFSFYLFFFPLQKASAWNCTLRPDYLTLSRLSLNRDASISHWTLSALHFVGQPKEISDLHSSSRNSWNEPTGSVLTGKDWIQCQ